MLQVESTQLDILCIDNCLIVCALRIFGRTYEIGNLISNIHHCLVIDYAKMMVNWTVAKGSI